MSTVTVEANQLVENFIAREEHAAIPSVESLNGLLFDLSTAYGVAKELIPQISESDLKEISYLYEQLGSEEFCLRLELYRVDLLGSPAPQVFDFHRLIEYLKKGI